MDSAEKQDAFALLCGLARGEPVADAYAPDALWHGSLPFEDRRGVDAVADVWAQLRRAVPDMERRDLIFVGDVTHPDPRMTPDGAGRPMIAAMGHLQGTFAADLCGIPATGAPVMLRYAEAHRLDGGRLVESHVMFDLVDLMRQAGCWPFAPALGVEGPWPGPATQDGLRLGPSVPGDAAMALVLAMHGDMGRFDGRSVRSMDQQRYWTPDFMWYGPGGVGTTRGLAAYEAHHQIPFLQGFPDRRGAGHYIRLAEGPYVVTGGRPSVVGTHLGTWLGLPPTGRRIAMRVMDFYRVDGDRIAENWVPIDILDMARQMGFNVLGRLAHLRGAPARDLPAG